MKIIFFAKFVLKKIMEKIYINEVSYRLKLQNIRKQHVLSQYINKTIKSQTLGWTIKNYYKNFVKWKGQIGWEIKM